MHIPSTAVTATRLLSRGATACSAIPISRLAAITPSSSRTHGKRMTTARWPHSAVSICPYSTNSSSSATAAEADKSAAGKDTSKEEYDSKWSVLPQLRGRSVATNRLWLNRFLEKKAAAETQPSSSSSGPRTPQILFKRMSDSYVEEYLPFKTDRALREEYINVYGTIRVGKILEDLDALAGSIAYAHCDDYQPDTPPLTIVTASVDRIDLLDRIPPDQDIRLAGFVTYVGKSSMEISITVETVPEGAVKAIQAAEAADEAGENVANGGIKVPHNFLNMIKGTRAGKQILAAKFTMVARDPNTGKAAPVNQLRLETDEERRLFRMGAEQKARKQVAMQTALNKLPPSVDEMYLIHELYLQYVKYLDPTSHTPKPDNVIWMNDTAQSTLVICMPQDRNIHNNIFGGYLMRLASELAFATGLLFSNSKVSFVALDDIAFRKPVPIGSLLSLTSQVVYSEGGSDYSFQVKVQADVVDPVKNTRETTNTFHFTFTTDQKEVPIVMPRSYDER
ncbi:Acyl-coenzyme A thioesterase 9, mitochondrial [Quaeritorhiza haematococci]|nr:Acyl-coenzyme A thioesterase 9, mitochondrial [Quaeritorhiza haematococci]